MHNQLWKTWGQIEEVRSGRPVLLYGRSEDWVHKAISNLGVTPVAIVDQNWTHHETNFRDLPVVHIDTVQNLTDFFVVVTAGTFSEIVKRLENSGLEPGRDFVLSPDFQDYASLLDIKGVDLRILVSSSDYQARDRARSSELGGGLYVLSTASGDLRRVYRGSTRQIKRIDTKRIAVVEHEDRQVLVMNNDFSIEDRISIEFPNACGIAFDEDTEQLLVANSRDDAIVFYDLATKAEIKQVRLGSVRTKGGHHLNDLAVADGYLFASFFSWSGFYMQGVFDGGVAAWDLRNSNRSPELVIQNLWKPHSPTFIGGQLFVLDSMRGELRSGSPVTHQKFNAFVRGIDARGDVLAVAQSENMYVSEMQSQGGSTNLANAGVNVALHFDRKSQITRFVSTPKLMNIHDVMILDD